MGALVQGFINFLKLQAVNKVRQGAADDRLGDRENRKRLAARAFLEGYEPDPRLFAKGSDDAPDIVVPDPLVDQTETALPPQAPVAPQLVPAGPGPSVVGENEYIVREIERINQNVAAIALAMEQNVRSDAEYRQSVIQSQRERLAQRGAARSQRRASRRRGFFSKLVGTAGAPVQRAGGRLRRAGKELGKGLLGFAALQTIDQLKKKYDQMESQIMEFLRNIPGIGSFFGEPEPTPDTGGALIPSPGAETPEAKAAISLIRDVEGTTGKAGASTFFGGGQPYGNIEGKTFNEVADLQRQFLKEGKGKFWNAQKGKWDQSAAVGVGQFMEPENALRTYLGEDPATTKFTEAKQVQLMIAIAAKKRGVDLNKPLTIEDIRKLNPEWSGLGPYYGQTTRTHEESLRMYNERLKKMQTQKVNFVMPDASKPGAPAGGGYKIGDVISYLPPIYIDQTTKKANKELGAGMSPGFDVASAVMDPSLGRSVYEPLLGIGVG